METCPVKDQAIDWQPTDSCVLVTERGVRMTNNDVLRRVRYIFDYSDNQMIELFALAELNVTREQVSNWMKKDDDPDFIEMEDVELAIYLNGLIIKNRGKKDGPQAEPENVLSNNIILRKIKIAMNFKDIDMIETFALVNWNISKHELSAFFRKPVHKNYRNCNDQILRNFLSAMQVKYRE